MAAPRFSSKEVLTATKLNLVADAIDAAALTPVSSSYTLPVAGASTLGGVKVGSGLSVAGDGTLSASGGGSYTLPIAGASTLGGIKVGSGLAVAGDGTLSASGGGSGTVSSVDASGGTTGFGFSGGPITGSGTLTLSVSNAGTARAALGLGTAATQASTAFAAASHTHVASEVSGLPYDVSFFAEGTLTNGEVFGRFICTRAFTIASGASGQAKSGTASAGSAVLVLNKNGSAMGTITFSTSATGTVSVTSTTSFAAGDVITAQGPATADGSLADIAITLAGTRP